MLTSTAIPGLELTAEEAYALLDLAMTSPNKLDATSEAAIHKLARFCGAIEEAEASSLRVNKAAG